MSYRDLFAVFYGIFFASVLSSCWGLGFFQWGAFFRSPHKTLRLSISLLLLNILPALYFAWVYSNFPLDQVSDFLKILCVFLIALSVFGFYRIYHLLLSFKAIHECLYEKREKIDNPELKRRLDIIGLWPGQAVSILFYFGLAWLSWRLIVR